MGALPVPAPAVVDAKSRAFRTLVQGLAVDVLTTVAVAVAVPLADLHWTKEYWLGIGALVAKSAVVAVASYVMRRIKPPATS
jgi:hypothetical protein